ncbi:hypothetical protein P280DRAFT_237696 [Massarina eburnea CBS 473.64]|uniref:Secreted protein n=1 Tax=Massarina eburnea CBS 473.64 TaxID=1395130 RepID=A0A6A6RH51_9PLEO|nr:hypothetical protein P280DRAFT_237696 [Massarina eburnea CBS 473.64]
MPWLAWGLVCASVLGGETLAVLVVWWCGNQGTTRRAMRGRSSTMKLQIGTIAGGAKYVEGIEGLEQDEQKAIGRLSHRPDVRNGAMQPQPCLSRDCPTLYRQACSAHAFASSTGCGICDSDSGTSPYSFDLTHSGAAVIILSPDPILRCCRSSPRTGLAVPRGKQSNHIYLYVVVLLHPSTSFPNPVFLEPAT